jgi:hypothetical protein
MAVGVRISLVAASWRRCAIAVISRVGTASGRCVFIYWRAARTGWRRTSVGISAVVVVARWGTSAAIVVITARAVTTGTARRTTPTVSVVVIRRGCAVTTAATTTRRRRTRTVTGVARRWGWHARNLGLGLE